MSVSTVFFLLVVFAIVCRLIKAAKDATAKKKQEEL